MGKWNNNKSNRQEAAVREGHYSSVLVGIEGAHIMKPLKIAAARSRDCWAETRMWGGRIYWLKGRKEAHLFFSSKCSLLNSRETSTHTVNIKLKSHERLPHVYITLNTKHTNKKKQRISCQPNIFFISKISVTTDVSIAFSWELN